MEEKKRQKKDLTDHLAYLFYFISKEYRPQITEVTYFKLFSFWKNPGFPRLRWVLQVCLKEHKFSFISGEQRWERATDRRTGTPITSASALRLFVFLEKIEQSAFGAEDTDLKCSYTA